MIFNDLCKIRILLFIVAAIGAEKSEHVAMYPYNIPMMNNARITIIIIFIEVLSPDDGCPKRILVGS